MCNAIDLRPGGIPLQLLPGGGPVVVPALARAIGDVFGNVRVFRSMDGTGCHFPASATSVHSRTAAEPAARLPRTARRDVLGWDPCRNAEQQLQSVTGKEVSLQSLLDSDREAPRLTDDRPVNEYYFLHQYSGHLAGETSHVATMANAGSLQRANFSAR